MRFSLITMLLGLAALFLTACGSSSSSSNDDGGSSNNEDFSTSIEVANTIDESRAQDSSTMSLAHADRIGLSLRVLDALAEADYDAGIDLMPEDSQTDDDGSFDINRTVDVDVDSDEDGDTDVDVTGTFGLEGEMDEPADSMSSNSGRGRFHVDIDHTFRDSGLTLTEGSSSITVQSGNINLEMNWLVESDGEQITLQGTLVAINFENILGTYVDGADSGSVLIDGSLALTADIVFNGDDTPSVTVDASVAVKTTPHGGTVQTVTLETNGPVELSFDAEDGVPYYIETEGTVYGPLTQDEVHDLQGLLMSFIN